MPRRRPTAPIEPPPPAPAQRSYDLATVATEAAAAVTTLAVRAGKAAETTRLIVLGNRLLDDGNACELLVARHRMRRAAEAAALAERQARHQRETARRTLAVIDLELSCMLFGAPADPEPHDAPVEAEP